MKITRRQLRRIIRESMVTKGTPYSRSPDAEMAAAEAESMDQYGPEFSQVNRDHLVSLARAVQDSVLARIESYGYPPDDIECVKQAISVINALAKDLSVKR